MSLFKAQMQKWVYFVLHPLLRLYREKLNPSASGARAVILLKGEVLLVRNIGVEKWSLPGGIMGRFESPMRCLRRELREELGLSIASEHYRYKLGVYKREGTVDTIHIFVISVPSFRYRKDWELDEARWFRLDDLPENLSPATRARLREFKEGKRDMQGEW
jgi:8-oxo-dGTP pyrophosphatase MutT (NUDIX family)